MINTPKKNAEKPYNTEDIAFYILQRMINSWLGKEKKKEKKR